LKQEGVSKEIVDELTGDVDAVNITSQQFSVKRESLETWGLHMEEKAIFRNVPPL
jgi:hypothetical protein